MKILIATDTYYPHVNGASYFTQRLAVSLRSRQHEVLVVAPARGWRAETYQQAGITIVGLPSFPTGLHHFRIALPVFLRAKVQKILVKFQPDVVHIQGHFFIGRAAAGAARKAGVALVGTNHFMPENLIHYVPLPVWLRRVVHTLMWRDFRRVFAPLSVITTPTTTAAALLKEQGLTQEIQALSCGIDRRLFHPGQASAYLRERYKIPPKPVLLYVGRLDREKNVGFILRSFAEIPAPQRPHCVIAGRGAEEKHLRQMVHELGLAAEVTFTGFVPNEDLPALYCLADAFIIASIAELQSLVTMEAMASGLPILAVAAMALPELVESGENGYLFSGEDTHQLAEQITSLMNNPSLREAMGQESLRRIAQHDLAIILPRYEALYGAAKSRGAGQ